MVNNDIEGWFIVDGFFFYYLDSCYGWGDRFKDKSNIWILLWIDKCVII